MPTSRPVLRLLARLTLSVVSLVLCLAVLEGTLRIFRLTPLETRHKTYDPARPFRRMSKPPYAEYKPNLQTNQVYHRCRRGVCKVDEVIPFDINSEGFRDHDYDRQKPPGVYRVLCLGDSFTAGDGVQLSQSYPKVLERDLGDQLSGSTEVEALNMGIIAYNTWEEWNYLYSHGLKWEPDAVVVGMYLNDPLDSIFEQVEDGTTVMPGERARMDDGYRPASNVQDSRFYRQPLYLHRWLLARLDARQTLRATKKWYRDLWDHDTNQEGMQQLEAALSNLANLRIERRLPVLVVVFPWLDLLDKRYPFDAIHDQIESLCAERDLAHLDLLDPVRQLDDGTEIWAHESDHHPSPEVHALAAEQIARRLQSDQRFRLPVAAEPPGKGSDP